VTAENIAAFIDENLSQARFRDYVADPDRAVLAARDDGRIVGYVMLIRGVPDDDDVQQAVTLRPAVELSKMYVLPDCHGAGVSAALMTAALNQATDWPPSQCGSCQSAQPTRATLLRQARLYDQRHQELSARLERRGRLRDGAPGLTGRGQRQQPRRGPQIFLSEATRQHLVGKDGVQLRAEATTGMPAS